MPVVNCVFDQKLGQHNSLDKLENVHVMNNSISRLATKSLCNYNIIRLSYFTIYGVGTGSGKSEPDPVRSESDPIFWEKLKLLTVDCQLLIVSDG